MYCKSKKLLTVIMTVAMAFCMLFAFGAFSASADEVVTEAPTTTNYEFVMNEKASVKTQDFDEAEVEVKNAIRFTSTIKATEEFKNDLKNFNVKVKTIIVKTESLGSETFTKENLDEKKIAYQQVIFNGKSMPVEKDGYYTFNACLYNVKDENFTKEFSAISYIEINGVATQYTETTATRSLWNVAEAHKKALEEDYDNVLESDMADEYAYVSSLCATYEVKVTGFDGEVATYNIKHGEYLDADKIAEDLNVEGTAYFTGTINGLDITKCVITSTEVTANMAAMTFEENATGYTLTSISGINAYSNGVYNVPAKYNGKDVNSMAVNNSQGIVFKSNANLVKVSLPETITELNDREFMQCHNMVQLIAPGVKTLKGQHIFSYCEDLKFVVFGSELSSIATNMFYNNSDINQDNVVSANQVKICIDGAVSALSTTAISATGNDLLEVIDGKHIIYTYNDSTGVVHGPRWYLDENNSIVITNEEHAFVNGECSCGDFNTQGVQYTYNGNGGYNVTGFVSAGDAEINVLAFYNDGTNDRHPVVRIHDQAFRNDSKNNGITKITLPESVTALGQRAFMWCTQLVTVIAPGVVTFERETGTDKSYFQFYECKALETVVLSGEITTIPDQVFMDGTVTAGNGKVDILIKGSTNKITSIGESGNQELTENVYVYNDSTGLVHGYYWYEENGEIVKKNGGEHDFVDGVCECGKWETINNLGVAYAWDETKEMYYVTGLADTSVKEVTILGVYNDGEHGPAKVYRVAASAFVRATITKVVMHENVYKIDDRAFMLCSELTYVDAKGVFYLDGTYQFAYDDKITTIILGGKLGGLTNGVLYDDDNDEFGKNTCVYIYGDPGNFKLENVQTASNQMFSEDRLYYYSKDYAEGCWHYDDATGMPILWTAEQA